MEFIIPNKFTTIYIQYIVLETIVLKVNLTYFNRQTILPVKGFILQTPVFQRFFFYPSEVDFKVIFVENCMH